MPARPSRPSPIAVAARVLAVLGSPSVLIAGAVQLALTADAAAAPAAQHIAGP